MTLQQLQEWRERAREALGLRLERRPPEAADGLRRREVLVCSGGACVSCGNASVSAALRDLIGKHQLTKHVKVVETGCVGCCDLGVVVQIMPDGVLYRKVTEKDIRTIVERHLIDNQVVTELLHREDEDSPPYAKAADMPFFKRQVKVVLENCGLIDPTLIDDYVACDGYQALAKALGGMEPEDVVAEVTASGLRGRGGGGFPAGKKWAMLAAAPGTDKYVICNGDEGDPGAFMDRSVLESDPHRVLEGMLIAGYATRSRRGVLYVRAEYPLAIRRLQIAIDHARQHNLLGERVLGSDFAFDVEIRVGAGAFVCGEETSLMASVEGRRGQPRPRPPYPVQAGLHGKPTMINNVETFANIPPIIRNGSDWFRSIGVPHSTGTKVFALAGRIRNTGLVEVPMGITLRELVFDIGGGVLEGKRFKAAQTGGPSGGCLPEQHLDLPLDFDSLQRIGSIMGSGGLIVMDETSCMVDVARFFMDFCVDESCGKCPPCRVGTRQMLNLLGKITGGTAGPRDLERLEELAGTVAAASLCGLGMTAPNPVRSTLRHFREEYWSHLHERRCPAGICRDLFLAPCENACPLHMNIPGYLQLLAENRMEEAFEMILLDNPLPGLTGRVCQHPCQSPCRRSSVDEPVATRDVHRYIADVIYREHLGEAILRRLRARQFPPTGRKVAIVGAGPGGLTAAFYLALLGHDVTVLDREAEPGGMLRYAIPEYRIPRPLLETELQFIRGLGVEFVPDTEVDAARLAELAERYDAVFLAAGAWGHVSAHVPGSDLPGVWHAVDFLQRCALNQPPAVGGNVVVIGGGNAAVDSARTAMRLGAKVTIVYRRERADMPAIVEEVQDAEAEGVSIMFMTGIEEVLDNGRGSVAGITASRMKAGGYDRSGRRKPVPTGETFTIPCHTVILAIGEKVDSAFVRDFGINVQDNGTVPVAAGSLQTSDSRIFAGGDMVTGPSNVTLAMAAGKKAAQAIDLQLSAGGENGSPGPPATQRFRELFKGFVYKNVVPLKPEGGPMSRGPHLPVVERVTCFREVSLGLSSRQARDEALRCLRCDVREPGDLDSATVRSTTMQKPPVSAAALEK